MKMYAKAVLGALLLLNVILTTQGFNVGVGGTKCNLDLSKGEINDPCGSLYDGVCKGRYCACPAGTHEDKNLGRCRPGEGSKTAGGTQAGRPGSPFDDLPFDFPGGGGSAPKTPAQPPAQPRPNPPPQPGQPQPGQPQPGWNPNQPGYNPNQPGYNPNQPGYNPNQPGYNPNQPGYNPNQPGYNPNQPGQPGYNPNQPGQPGYNPNQPGQPGYNPNQPGKPGYNPNQRGGSKGGSDVGEKAGGGVGGVLGLLLIGGLIYFCCCRGGKHKQVMNRFQGIPFIGGRGGQGGQGSVAMQSQPVQQDPNFGSQHTYIPPGQPGELPPPGQYPPPQQPYPAGGVYPAVPYGQQPGYAPYPPQGYPANGQQPPPYTQQYQPNAPPV